MKYARKYVKEISMARKHVKQTNSKKKKKKFENKVSDIKHKFTTDNSEQEKQQHFKIFPYYIIHVSLSN